MKKSVLQVLLVILFCSCVNNKVDKKSIDLKSFKKINNKINSLIEGVKNIKIIKLETSEKSIIGNIDKIVCDVYGNFYVGDFGIRKKVLKFDKNGNFLMFFGEEGQGPGEFSEMIDFDVDNEGGVIILTPYKLIKFSGMGKRIREKRIFFSGKK